MGKALLKLSGTLKALLGILAIFCVSALQIQGQKYTREQYIAEFSDLAMQEMIRVGIPASITLAQGCLESDNGNSRLATRANNHFGIKCHDWTGKKIYHDDDRRRECFRSYASAYESFMDHSLFLTTRNRYAALFELDEAANRIREEVDAEMADHLVREFLWRCVVGELSRRATEYSAMPRPPVA